MSLGVTYHQAEVHGFNTRILDKHSSPHGRSEDAEDIHERRKLLFGATAQPKMTGSSSRPIHFYQCINAAGPWAGDIARMAGIGSGNGILGENNVRLFKYFWYYLSIITFLGIPMPIRAFRRQYFVVHAPEVPALEMPALKDPSGVFCRPYEPGYSFICGRTPTKEEDKHTNHSNDKVDYNYFYQKVWPVLCHRVPTFKEAKVVNAWTCLEVTKAKCRLHIIF